MPEPPAAPRVAATAGPAILWDVDGTLLRAAGTGVHCFREALSVVVGVDFPAGPFDMGGRTDPEIGAMILDAAGVEAAAHLEALLGHVALVYEREEAAFAGLTAVKPGVVDALDALDGHGALQTLVTGNLESVARRKVRAAGVDHRLRLDVGGYGSDATARADLVAVARRRIADAGGPTAASHTWIVGDTPRDLRCARDNGVRCALVATGTHPLAELATLGADAVFPDLTDLPRLLETLLD